jgi:hypothetical protein
LPERLAGSLKNARGIQIEGMRSTHDVVQWLREHRKGGGAGLVRQAGQGA